MGRGTEHLILSAFLSQSWQIAIYQNDVIINIKDGVFGSGITYLGIRTVAVETHVLGGIRTLYS